MAGGGFPRLTSKPMPVSLLHGRSPWRALAFWLAGALIGGVGLGAAILVVLYLVRRSFDLWFLQASVWFSLFVAAAAFISSRFVLPLFVRAGWLVRYGLTLLTLLGAGLAATLLAWSQRAGVVWTSDFAFFLGLSAVNLLLALIIGGALIGWDGLRRSLERAYAELSVKDAIEKEMSIAREVQQDLLPRSAPQIPGLEFAFTIRSAAMVGGDTIDFLDLSDGSVGLAVGDVVGKGMAAALMMANLHALVQAVAAVELEPDKLNTLLSEVIANRARPGRFVTLAYVALHPDTGRIRYSLAGHHPPLIVSVDHKVRALEAGGMPLGLYAGATYEAGSDILAVGETLLLYTDGLIEAPHKGNEELHYGHDRLKEVAREHHIKGPEALLAVILESLENHLAGAPPADDTTILVVRRVERS